MSERRRKQLALEHSRRLTAGDLDALLELYADEVTVEDPVGHDRLTGRDAVREHFAQVIEGNIRETPGRPVVGQDDTHVLLPVTAVMDHLPYGRVLAARGRLPAPLDPAGARLRRRSMQLFRTDGAGRISGLRAFWGRSDLEVPGTPAVPVPGEAARKQMALDYARRFNAHDVDGVLALFADDIVFEDPVGRPPVVGKDGLRLHLELALLHGAHEVPGPPVTSMCDRYVVTPTTVTVRRPRPMTFDIVGIVELREDGLGARVQAFWGVSDVTMDEPADTGRPATVGGPPA